MCSPDHDEELVPVEAESVSTAFRPMNVLVVEDSKSNQMLIEHYLKGSGHKLFIAENGLEGLEMYKKNRDTDIIFMDMQMPVMDGIDATRAIRAYEQEQNLPPVEIVALTANAFDDDKRRCLDSGCDKFLAKPVRKADLLAVISAGMKC